jgi:hypothetical protein
MRMGASSCWTCTQVTACDGRACTHDPGAGNNIRLKISIFSHFYSCWAALSVHVPFTGDPSPRACTGVEPCPSIMQARAANV